MLGQYYILQVELKYLYEILDCNNDSQVSPKLLNITSEMLSETHYRLILKYLNANTPGSNKTHMFTVE